MAHEEYLRRNLLHCSAVGCAADVRVSLARLLKMKRAPKWLIANLQGALDRADKVHPEMAKWRNHAPDAPEATAKFTDESTH